jgi:hypothetical protein
MDLPIYQPSVIMFVRMLKDFIKVHGPQQQSVHTILPFRAVSGNMQYFVVCVYALLCLKYAVI